MMVATGTFPCTLHSCMRWILQLLLLQVLSTSAAAQLTSYVKIDRASVDSLNNQADAESGAPSLSGNGRYVAFWSRASNLVAGDTNGQEDVFVRDRLLAITERVSVDSAGSQANGSSDVPSLSADGRYVAFGSDASNLVHGDTNQSQDVFVHDRLSGTTERMSINTAGHEGNSHSVSPSISADGRYVAFGSTASNLAAGDTNGQQDVYVRDRISGTTLRVSVDMGGGEGPYDSNSPSISADGRYVAFVSNNNFAGRKRGGRDIFVRDLQAATTELVSLDNAGHEGMGDSISPFISAEGRYVVFESAANLVDGGTNGPRTDVFIRDRFLRTTERVSTGRNGVTADGSAFASNPSTDARYVAFWSDATNLVAEDNNGAFDAFVRDRATSTTLRVSINAANRGEGNANTLFPSISGDGHHVAFVSLASNLVAGDTNERADVFVASQCDRATCGDGVLNVECEQCDDGNLVDGDGCDSNCTVTGCGNGVITAGEQCDDGNLIDADGCESNCTFTPPSPTRTATPTQTPTRTPTPSPSPTPTSEVVHIDIGAAAGAPGGTVQIPITIRSSGFGTVATGNDITYRNDLFELAPERCALNPDLPKTLTTGVLVSGFSSTVRVFVQSPENTTVIPDGLVYSCSFRINANTLPGTYALANTSIIVFAQDGKVHDAVTGIAGGIVVSLLAGPTSTPSATPTATIGKCIGDCDGERTVTVNELVTMVNIALGTAHISECLAGDANHDGEITIEEIIAAVHIALTQCPAS